MGQKLRIIQSVYNKGELSPRLKGRVDNQAYYKSYDDGINFLPFPEGSGTFRPGSVFVHEVKDSTKDTILVEFRFSTVQNYIIEFGDQYVRFYRNRGQIESGGSPYEVSTPYLEADLRDLYFFQSADVLYILHHDYQTRKLIRTSDTSWALAAIDFVDGPYLPINSTSTTFSYSSGVITASAATFSSGDVGRAVRIKDSGHWHFGTITAYTDTTHVDVDLYDEIGGSITSHTISATTSWQLGVFGGDLGWPAVGSIFEERLILARTAAMPSTIWGSRTGEFEIFSPSDLTDGTVRDDDGFTFTIGDDQVNAINWISSGRQMLIGTTGGEHSMTGGTSGGYAPITPSNVTIKRESNFGSKPSLRAHRIGNAVIYSSPSGRKIREMYYEFGIDSYISRDITIFSEHILKKGVVSSCYVQEPDPYLWNATEDGKLVGMVYDRLQEIEGWHKHQIAGTNAKVISVAQIPKPGDESDDLWMIVERTIDGSTVKYVEYLSEIYENVEAPIIGVDKRQYAKFLDSCITYDGFYNAGITLSALTGSGVTVTADTAVFSSGDVGSQIRVGLSKATVTAYTDTTHVTVTVVTDFTSLTYSAGEWSMASKNFSGLDHLEAETVSIIADGYVTDDEVVSSGSVSIDNYASVVHVGLSYECYIKFLLPEFPSLGTIQGRVRSTSKLHIYVTDTYGLKVNDSKTDITDTIKFLKFPIVTETAPDLKNGLISIEPPSGYERDSQIKLVHDTPTPFTLNYVVQDLDVND